jgi:hypothetical protein
MADARWSVQGAPGGFLTRSSTTPESIMPSATRIWSFVNSTTRGAPKIESLPDWERVQADRRVERGQLAHRMWIDPLRRCQVQRGALHAVWIRRRNALENGGPVILDPRVPRNCLDCGIALAAEGPVAVSPRDAVEWTAQLAEQGAAATRNGPGKMHRARNAMTRLVDQGVPPSSHEIEGIAWLLALAEQVAQRYGGRAIAIVRSTAQAVADLAEEAIAKTARNVSVTIAGTRLEPAPWVSALARITGRVGATAGMTALRIKLASMGVPPHLVNLVEQELQAEGLDVGTFGVPQRRSPRPPMVQAE